MGVIQHLETEVQFAQIEARHRVAARAGHAFLEGLDGRQRLLAVEVVILEQGEEHGRSRGLESGMPGLDGLGVIAGGAQGLAQPDVGRDERLTLLQQLPEACGRLLRLAVLEARGRELVADSQALPPVGVIEASAREALDPALSVPGLIPVLFLGVQRARLAPGGDRSLVQSENLAQHGACTVHVALRLVVLDQCVERLRAVGLQVLCLSVMLDRLFGLALVAQHFAELDERVEVTAVSLQHGTKRP